MIGLMDCNNFFVSCERLFRPDLGKKPVAVLSSNDGCIVSRSQEVKDMGIPMGVPYFKVRELCEKEGVTLFSSNFRLYRDISARVMAALKEEVDVCEVYSIDESFFEIAASVTEKDMLALRTRIMQKAGIPVSFGIAGTKTIAKAASTYAKKGSGVSIFDTALWRSKVNEIPCGSIWGIGRRTTERLRKDGLATVGELISKDISYFRNQFGIVGERLYLELTGTSVYGVGDEASRVEQSLTSTRSFHADVREKQVLESALGYHIAHIGEKLRERGLVASHLRILAAPSRFSDLALRRGSLDTELSEPTSDTAALLKESLRLFESLYDPEVPYKKAGVIVTGIMPKALVSGSLFGRKETGGSETLYEIADNLNERFGHGTVRPGVVLNTEKWRESARLRSPEYTTRWNEIASVKAI